MSWITAPLNAVTKAIGGGTPSKANDAYWNGHIPWVSPKDMTDREIHGAVDHITMEAVSSSATQLVPSGAVLVVVRSGILVRRLPIAITSVPVALNQDMKAFLCKNQVLPDFLAYFLASKEAQILQNFVKKGATVHSISMDRFGSLPVPIPAKKEQSRIVELLDKADRLRRLRREADAKAARILPALFLKMFGDPATNPMGWRMKPLGDLADQRPEYGANASACPREKGMPRYVRITDIRDSGTLSDKDIVSLDSTGWQRYLLDEGDILFARSGNTVGKTYIYRPTDGPCAFAGYLIRFKFRSGSIDPWFVFGLTRTAYFRGWVQSHKRVAGQPNINGQEYSSLLIPEPPELFQKQYGKLAKSVESLLVKADAAADQLETTFATLLQQAFSGQLTAKWREAHMRELLAEMALQARGLNLRLPKELEALS